MIPRNMVAAHAQLGKPANIPKPSIATPVETTAAKYSVRQDISLEARVGDPQVRHIKEETIT